MPASTKAQSDENWNDTESPDEDWNEVAGEIQVKFDTIGDTFTGYLQQIDSPMQNGMIQAHFIGSGEFAGNEYFMNCGRDLVRKLQRIPLRPGQKVNVRIELVEFMDTGQKSPMSVYKVQYR